MSLPRTIEQVFPVKSPLGRIGLACAVKRTYTLAPGKLTLADEQVPLVLFPDFELTKDGDRRALLDDSDMLPVKEVTDVVLQGSAHAPSLSREIPIALAVSGFVRRLRVTGERHALVSPDGQVRFSSPEPFLQVKLGHEVAYGGYDAYAHDRLDPAPPILAPSPLASALGPDVQTGQPGPRYPGIFAYPRNHAGVGYFIDLDRPRADGAALPRVEDPDDLLTPERFFLQTPLGWIDAPIPGSLGWVAYAWYPRIHRCAGNLLPAHAPTRPLREAALGDGADLLEPPAPRGIMRPQGLQGAAPGLARERLRGDEPVVLENLHPRHPELHFRLPGEAPLFTLRPPGLKAFSPRAILQTVRIEPDRDRVVLTWIGVVPLAAPPGWDFVDQAELGISWAKVG